MGRGFRLDARWPFAFLLLAACGQEFVAQEGVGGSTGGAVGAGGSSGFGGSSAAGGGMGTGGGVGTGGAMADASGPPADGPAPPIDASTPDGRPAPDGPRAGSTGGGSVLSLALHTFCLGFA